MKHRPHGIDPRPPSPTAARSQVALILRYHALRSRLTPSPHFFVVSLPDSSPITQYSRADNTKENSPRVTTIPGGSHTCIIESFHSFYALEPLESIEPQLTQYQRGAILKLHRLWFSSLSQIVKVKDGTRRHRARADGPVLCCDGN